MEVGLVIVLLAVASAGSMLLLGRYAPNRAPAGLTAVLAGHTAAGHPWTLDPDYSQPGRIRWIWRCPLQTEPIAGWRGERLAWDAAAFRATGRMGDPPDGAPFRLPDWTVVGERVPAEIVQRIATAPAAVTAFAWDVGGWVAAEIPTHDPPEALVAFAGALADALSPRRDRRDDGPA